MTPGKTSNGKYHLKAEGAVIKLIPLGYEEKQKKELANRLQAMLPTAKWHREQAFASEKAKEWFAAAFHWRRLVQMQKLDLDARGRWANALENLKQQARPRRMPRADEN